MTSFAIFSTWSCLLTPGSLRARAWNRWGEPTVTLEPACREVRASWGTSIRATTRAVGLV
jgi:hypothetical protein